MTSCSTLPVSTMALILEVSGPSDSMTVIPLSSWKGRKYASRWASWKAPPQDCTRTSPEPLRFSGIPVVLRQRRRLLLRAGVERNTGFEQDAGGGRPRHERAAATQQLTTAHQFQVAQHLALECAIRGLIAAIGSRGLRMAASTPSARDPGNAWRGNEPRRSRIGRICRCSEPVTHRSSSAHLRRPLGVLGAV